MFGFSCFLFYDLYVFFFILFPKLKNKSKNPFLDYNLPPHEEQTEILRVVVRWSMSRDLLDKLIGDICAVTETLIDADTADAAAASAGHAAAAPSIEKQHASAGHVAKHRHKGRRPMSHGVHRSVC